MKTTICLAASLLALNLTPVFGQPQPTTFAERLAAITAKQNESKANAPALTKFNLDFPGGTPRTLVAAIDKAMGKPLNVIIPDEDAETELPALKMNDVVVPQLFAALEAASQKQVKIVTRTFSGYPRISESYTVMDTSYGFHTDGEPSDNSIWNFHAVKPPESPVVPAARECRFYSLSAYLDRGFTVDDITTAIQTGWKMAGPISTELNYHKETKLLIAYGEPDKLNTIDDVLKTLPPSNITLQGSKYYWEQIQRLWEQINLLNKKIGVENVSTNSTPAEKSGK